MIEYDFFLFEVVYLHGSFMWRKGQNIVILVQLREMIVKTLYAKALSVWCPS